MVVDILISSGNQAG